MSDINAEDIRAAMADPDPVLEAFSLLLRSVAADAIQAVAMTLIMTGQDPSHVPGEYFAQAVLAESERVFLPISREKWIEIFDAYQHIRSLVDSDPELKAQVKRHREGTEQRITDAADAPRKSVDELLDGIF